MARNFQTAPLADQRVCALCPIDGGRLFAQTAAVTTGIGTDGAKTRPARAAMRYGAGDKRSWQNKSVIDRCPLPQPSHTTRLVRRAIGVSSDGSIHTNVKWAEK